MTTCEFSAIKRDPIPRKHLVYSYMCRIFPYCMEVLPHAYGLLTRLVHRNNENLRGLGGADIYGSPH